MDVDILAPSVDKSQMPPLHQKRILAFINHFLISSCAFLNEFALKCETKFIELERKMQKVEAALTIIEAKLASVPDVAESAPLNDVAGDGVVKNTGDEQTKVSSNVDECTEQHVEVNTEIFEPTGVRVCEDIRYKKFFKMVQFGVPAEAVKLKMQAEGVIPSILDTPNLLLEDGKTE